MKVSEILSAVLGKGCSPALPALVSSLHPHPAGCQPHQSTPIILMQLSPYVSELSLYDIAGTPGVAADISHINSKASVKGKGRRRGGGGGSSCQSAGVLASWAWGLCIGQARLK